MSREQNTTLGIWLMVAVTLVFAIQDGISTHLAGTYNVFMIIMIRYWFFATFVITVASRKAGGIRNAARTNAPKAQVFRGLLLALEILVAVKGFVVLGLVESHAVFAVYPLLIAALCAEGKTVIRNIGQIDRGYENIEGKLLELGAKIKRGAG